MLVANLGNKLKHPICNLNIHIYNHPLKFYDVITAYAAKNLKPSGKLYFEINQKFGNEMIELLKNFDFDNIELIKDINNNDRIIRGEKR